MIRLLALDVDGVLTNGEVRFDEDGRESKTLFYRDIDAVFAARQAGLEIVLVTGEDTPIVEVIARRLAIETVFRGHKDKAEAVHAIARGFELELDEIAYVGDAPRDAPALELVGLGLAPADAAPEARGAASRVLDAAGGRGAASEAIGIVLGTYASG